MTADARHTFLCQYAIIRRAEGRGSDDPAYYANLPYADTSGRNAGQWRIRARTFDAFVRRILVPLERQARRRLEVLDLGAGNGWLSWRLALRGHRPVPVDIFMDARDGLGAIGKYARLTAVAADFDCLPFGSGQFDLAIYNASLHYSANYARTLEELRRCLRPDGRFVILDSPLYHRAEHGERMRRERHAAFDRAYGFRSEALGSIEYLDAHELRRLSNDLGIEWTLRRVWYGWRWAMRPWIARVRRKRPPSRFCLIEGRFA